MRRRIRAMLPKIEAELPDGVRLQVHSDRSRFVKDSLHEVNFTLILALLLVIFFIFAFLHNVRATLIAALVLPSSLLGTFAFMYLQDYSLNNLSLMAITLAIGFVVDDAVVVIENIARHLEMGKPRIQAALDGPEIGAMLSMTISLAAVFPPILFGRHDRAAVPGSPSASASPAAVRRGGVTTPMLCARGLVNEPLANPVRGCRRRLCPLPRFWRDPARLGCATAAAAAVAGGAGAMVAAGQVSRVHPARSTPGWFSAQYQAFLSKSFPAPAAARRHRAAAPGGRGADVVGRAGRRRRDRR
jgi:hypothetical protein